MAEYISFQPSDYFNTTLYTGTGASNALTGVGFQPDFCWFKNRGTTNWHSLYDAVRGTTEAIASNDNDAEETRANGLTTFGSDGFTLGDDANVNANTNTYVSWNWKANGAGSANTDGDINSTVSVNTTAGFSIVKYTGNVTADQSIGHGLGVTPKMIIIKNLDTTGSWMVYHHSLGYNSGTIPRFLQLDNNNAQNNGGTNDFPAPPTSSVFKVGSYSTMNGSGNDIIAYCFLEKTGYSKFGSYTGNGDGDGPFVYTGFRPAWVMIKSTTSAEGWFIYDNKRLGYNPDNNYVYADDTAVEGTPDNIDILSNGFKVIRYSSAFNTSGGVFIYAAFAEAPFVNSNGVPCNAR